MKIAIIGPTHPYKGGIPQHTTELAHRLAGAGHSVQIISWSRQYPFFYPGEQFVPDGQPELPVFPGSKRVLSWRNPAGWFKQARQLRTFDEVIFVWWVPTIQGPVYLSMLKALGKKPRKVLIAHNVIQHSAGPADKRLTRAVFKRVDKLIVHSQAQAELAKSLTNTSVTIARMAAHLPSRPSQAAGKRSLRHELLFFGLVRHYKGVDVLLKALAKVPGVRLTIAGEAWGKAEANLRQSVDELGLTERVTLRLGYVPSSEIEQLFSKADTLVLPYRSGTATQNAELAFAHGLPVIATRVGSLPEQLRDGTDSLLCEPDDVDSLAKAIKRFYEPGVAEKLRKSLPASTADADWQAYVKAVTS